MIFFSISNHPIMSSKVFGNVLKVSSTFLTSQNHFLRFWDRFWVYLSKVQKMVKMWFSTKIRIFPKSHNPVKGIIYCQQRAFRTSQTYFRSIFNIWIHLGTILRKIIFFNFLKFFICGIFKKNRFLPIWVTKRDKKS